MLSCVLLYFGKSIAAVDEFFFIQDLRLNFHSFLGFQHGTDLSVNVIMLLSATLPLAIGLKRF